MAYVVKVYTMARQKYSENFYFDEFSCKCGCGIGIMQPRFIERLQELRDEWGKPIMITSGLRCIAHNIASSGSKKSRHLIGAAADIAIDSSAERYALVALAVKKGFRGIGVGKTFVHLDLREKNPVLWLY